MVVTDATATNVDLVPFISFGLNSRQQLGCCGQSGCFRFFSGPRFVEEFDLPKSTDCDDDRTNESVALLEPNDPVENFPETAGPGKDNVPPLGTSLVHKLSMGMAVTLPFVGCMVAIVMLWSVGWMGWPYLAMLIGGWLLTGLGITVGFHRLLTHRSFETYRWVRAIWMTLGALSVEGSPLVWCAVHRRHHEHSDEVGDPHSPNLHRGGIWNAL